MQSLIEHYGLAMVLLAVAVGIVVVALQKPTPK
ncbi:hypothetical protein J2X36_003320 [Methylobacterium sp. BE186]|nr:hypothetical protein [Methylobacterium sp. BE186]